MAIYSKFCIICQKEFRTMRIGSIFCGKKCANRCRSLPLHIRESLIRRNSGFTVVLDNRPQHRIQDETALAITLAKEELRKRGRDIPTDLTVGKVTAEINNEQYIYKEDPANQGPEGFGVQSSDNTQTKEEQPVLQNGLPKLKRRKEI